MPRTLTLTLAAAVAVTGFIAAGAIAGTGSQTGATVSLRQTKLGEVVVNAKSHTVYLFTKDRNGASSCTGQCATYWPPLVVRGTPSAGPGIKKSLLRTTKRSNGSLQVEYNRHPLYMYAEDTKPGQTHGQRESAFGGRWYAVSAAGKAVTKAPSGTGTSTTTTTETTTTTTYTSPYP